MFLASSLLADAPRLFLITRPWHLFSLSQSTKIGEDRPVLAGLLKVRAAGLKAKNSQVASVLTSYHVFCRVFDLSRSSPRVPFFSIALMRPYHTCYWILKVVRPSPAVPSEFSSSR